MSTRKSKRSAGKKAKPDSLHRLVRAWSHNPNVTVWIDKCDGSGEYEKAKIIRFVAITQPLEGELFVEGITNNQATVDVDADDVLLKSPND